MSATLFLEGGARDSKELRIRCREGFRKLLESCGYKRPKMPGLTACGPRDNAFADFKTALAGKGAGDYVAMWIDSEDPMKDHEAAWGHLKLRDGWTRPAGAADDQVLFMTTCMETLIVADHDALKKHCGAKLQISALPPLVNLESRDRHNVHDQLEHATRNCANKYKKGERSFKILAELNPAALEDLPSFVRTRRILDEKLQ